MTTRGCLIATLIITVWLPLETLPWQATAMAQRGDSGRRDNDDNDDDQSRGERRRRWQERSGRDGERSDGDSGRGRRGRDREEQADQNNDDSEREAENRPATANRTTSPAASSTAGGSALTTRNYARGLVAQNDKDGDMMLKGEERDGLRGKAAAADANNDGVITLDEMIATLSSDQPTPPSNDSTSTSTASQNDGQQPSERRESSSTAKNGDPSPRRLTNGDRKSYRFKPAKERLPSGLPSYFSRDANGDGQISMYEYSRYWTDRTASEFIRLDLNNDGIITPKEAKREK